MQAECSLISLLRQSPSDLTGTIAAAVSHHLLDCRDQERGDLTRFHARTLPTIALKDYLHRFGHEPLWLLTEWADVWLHRLVSFTPFPADVLVLSVYYLHRLASQSSQLSPCTKSEGKDPGEFHSMTSPGASIRSRRPHVNAFTVHRLFLAALVVSAKFLSDSYIPHSRACRVGGVGPAELAALEVELLVQLKFDLLWSMEALETLCQELLLGKFDPLCPTRSVGGEECSSSSVSTPSSEEAPSLAGGAGVNTPDSSAPPTPAPSTSMTPKLSKTGLGALEDLDEP